MGKWPRCSLPAFSRFDTSQGLIISFLTRTEMVKVVKGCFVCVLYVCVCLHKKERSVCVCFSEKDVCVFIQECLWQCFICPDWQYFADFSAFLAFLRGVKDLYSWWESNGEVVRNTRWGLWEREVERDSVRWKMSCEPNCILYVSILIWNIAVQYIRCVSKLHQSYDDCFMIWLLLILVELPKC